ncbi:MAG: hypothetical protein CVU62_00625 [Deltaproteobacteria bacterium HGW-Deltaproteobacteria-2]|jgi:hypothetical protein|nr:MAG: hypothetical protein CVU62_00625 [Deltaproteobacteria bacterium HGW-Deltaproteobacteria-2]
MLLLQSERVAIVDCPAYGKPDDGSSLPGMHDGAQRRLSFRQHKTVAWSEKLRYKIYPWFTFFLFLKNQGNCVWPAFSIESVFLSVMIQILRETPIPKAMRSGIGKLNPDTSGQSGGYDTP